MRRIALSICLMFALAACSSSYDLGANVKDGYRLGNYKVKSLRVVGANPAMSSDSDFLDMKPLLEQALVRAFTNVGNGPPAALTVRVTSVSSEVNAFKALMVGDSYLINGVAEVWDENRTRMIADVKVVSRHGPYGMGLAGVVNSAITDEQDELAYRNEVADLFAKEVRGAIHPEYDN